MSGHILPFFGHILLFCGFLGHKHPSPMITNQSGKRYISVVFQDEYLQVAAILKLQNC
jgi:hypothetical protein